MLRSQTRRRCFALLVFTSAVLLLPSVPALASTPSCSAGYTYYEPNQISTGADFSGIDGYISDPIASYLQGNNGNKDDSQHILLYLALWNEHPPGSLLRGEQFLLAAGGGGMGLVSGEWMLKHWTNYTEFYQVYYEDYSPSNCTDNFYSGISISQASSIDFDLYYDGDDGYTGYPQYQGYVLSSSGWQYVNEGELYDPDVHAGASTEIENGTTTTCAVLTDGSPWQNFGTDSSGNYDQGQYTLSLEPLNESYEDWAHWDSPTIDNNAAPFYYDQLTNFPNDYRANGPATGPA